MPRYICDGMLDPLDVAGVECVWYDLNDRLEVDGPTSGEIGDWLLYVNYFGVCNANVAELMRVFSPDHLVLDYAQSFFEPPQEAVLATIYSPRKFFGVPDGGLMTSRIPISTPQTQDTSSFGRMANLVRRLGESPEAGYADYQRSEASLKDCEPKRMSKLTERILSSINFEETFKKRRKNFFYLHKALGEANEFSIDTAGITAPLCYPFMTSDTRLRGKLIKNRIFVATYWRDALSRVREEWAVRMIGDLLPLPIDQRYGEKEMEKVASLVLGKDA